MKFSIQKNNIINVLSKIQGLTVRKTNLAITTNVLIKTVDSGISITATDLETGFEGIYPADVETEGILAINAKTLYDIVREFPSDKIDINEIENHWIEIRNNNVEYHIVGMDPEDFPDIPRMEDISFFEMASASLADMIDKTVIIAGASDDKRAHISGVLLESLEEEEKDKKSFRLVSTDGSRLSKVDYHSDQPFDLSTEKGVIVPKKGLNEVRKFLDQEDNVQIGIKNNNFIVKKDAEIIIVRLLEGEFPQYSDIINKEGSQAIKMNREKFLKMLKRMSILSSEEYKGVIFNFSDKKLNITSTNPDKGESKEDISIKFSG